MHAIGHDAPDLKKMLKAVKSILREKQPMRGSTGRITHGPRVCFLDVPNSRAVSPPSSINLHAPCELDIYVPHGMISPEYL